MPETPKQHTHAEILAEAGKYSPTGYRRRRKGQPIPDMDFSDRCGCVLEGCDELSDKTDGPLTIEQEPK